MEDREQEILEARLEVWIIYSSQEQEAEEHCCQLRLRIFRGGGVFPQSPSAGGGGALGNGGQGSKALVFAPRQD